MVTNNSKQRSVIWCNQVLDRQVGIPWSQGITLVLSFIQALQLQHFNHISRIRRQECSIILMARVTSRREFSFLCFSSQILPTHAFFVFRKKKMSGMAERSTCPGGLDHFHDLLDCRFSGGHVRLHQKSRVASKSVGLAQNLNQTWMNEWIDPKSQH